MDPQRKAATLIGRERRAAPCRRTESIVWHLVFTDAMILMSMQWCIQAVRSSIPAMARLVSGQAFLTTLALGVERECRQPARR